MQNNMPKPTQKGGCEIKVKRDSSGRVTGIKTNGMCSKSELEVFKENMSEDEDED